MTGLRAAAEPTRLRILALCGQSDLTVTDLTEILGQSQPRVSRHVKLLCDSGLLQRWRNGAWAFCQMATDGPGAVLAQVLADQIPRNDPTFQLDGRRLEALTKERAERAATFFRKNAAEWDTIRTMGIDQDAVEDALLAVLPAGGRLLDIGTGTGWVLRTLGPRVKAATGIDISSEMLAVARASLARAGLRNCVLRQGDMYRLPWADGHFDAATLHMVLHYADRPADAIAEAARVVRGGGRLMVVDFAPHDRRELRNKHAHVWLGFETSQVEGWLRNAGLHVQEASEIAGAGLSVVVWVGKKRDAHYEAAA